MQQYFSLNEIIDPEKQLREKQIDYLFEERKNPELNLGLTLAKMSQNPDKLVFDVE